MGETKCQKGGIGKFRQTNETPNFGISLFLRTVCYQKIELVKIKYGVLKQKPKNTNCIKA